MNNNIKQFSDYAEREADSKAAWTESFFIKKLGAYLTLIADKNYVARLRVRVSRICTHLGISKHDLYLMCILDHLGIIEQEALEGRGLENDIQWKQAVAIMKEKARIQADKDYVKDHQEIYNDLGPEKYEEWCNENGFDAQKLLDRYIDIPTAISENERIKLHLEYYLSRAGGPVSIETIKEELKETGYLTPDEQNWDAIRMVAQREGWTKGKRGYWQWRLT